MSVGGSWAEGNDHDFKPKEKVTPYGIFLPELDKLFYYFTTSKVTSDFIVDVLEAWWLEPEALNDRNSC
jgi:hypothetical protein